MKKLILFTMLLFTVTINAQESSQSFEEMIKPYVSDLLETVKTGAEFAVQEIPIVLMQYVYYEAITSWLLVLIPFILIPLTIKFAKKAIRIDLWEDGYFFACTTLVINGSISIFLFFYNIGTAIKATFFPKLFLVETFLNHI